VPALHVRPWTVYRRTGRYRYDRRFSLQNEIRWFPWWRLGTHDRAYDPALDSPAYKRALGRASLVSPSAEGIRVPYDRKEARRLADEIAGDASLTALG